MALMSGALLSVLQPRKGHGDFSITLAHSWQSWPGREGHGEVQAHSWLLALGEGGLD